MANIIQKAFNAATFGLIKELGLEQEHEVVDVRQGKTKDTFVAHVKTRNYYVKLSSWLTGAEEYLTEGIFLAINGEHSLVWLDGGGRNLNYEQCRILTGALVAHLILRDGGKEMEVV